MCEAADCAKLGDRKTSAAKAEKHTKQLCLARHVRHDGLSIPKGRVRRRARMSETQQPEALHMRHGRARSTEGLRRWRTTTESDRGSEKRVRHGPAGRWCGEARGPAGCAFVRLWHGRRTLPIYTQSSTISPDRPLGLCGREPGDA